MAEVYLQSRLDFLRSAQNADGGWGYFPGKQSWMEPTTYALLALQGTSEARGAVERGWRLAKSWRLGNGGWRPCAHVPDPTWVTALGVLLAACLGDRDPGGRRSIAWLLATAGAESRWTVRLASHLHFLKTDVNVDHTGWPWRPETSAWIEPTAITLLALKRAGQTHPRIRDGEELILSRRGQDGGWNSGNPNVLKAAVPSYPETTALALLGLQGRNPAALSGPLDAARGYLRDARSPLAQAWLRIALRCYGENPAAPAGGSGLAPDVLLCALEALAHPGGNGRLLRYEGRA